MCYAALMNPKLRPSRFRAAAALCLCWSTFFPMLRAADEPETQKALLSGLSQVFSVVAPVSGAKPQTFSATIKIVSAKGLPAAVVGREVALAFQSPDRLRLSATVEGENYTACRDRSKL